jgi:predicted GNAT superfamily acetyltransferase
MLIRDAVPADHAAIVAINDAAVPQVNALEPTYFAWLVANAALFRVAVDAEGVAGFHLCLPAGVDYWSENYRWFTARYDSFLYLDRVVVAERVRGKGVGTALYDDLHAWCAGRYPRVTLEVNLRPPNPGSMRFHERLGYRRVGELEHEGKDDYAVVLYERQVRGGRGEVEG